MQRATWVAAILLALLAALPMQPAIAQAVDPTPLEFRDAEEAARFHALAAELRCVKCQNQSLADSNAAVAQDLRNEVLALMRQGRSDAEVKEHLVARYGEFVLYRPAVRSSTWLLWFGPAVLLLLGAGAVAMVVRRRSRDLPAVGSEDQEW